MCSTQNFNQENVTDSTEFTVILVVVLSVLVKAFLSTLKFLNPCVLLNIFWIWERSFFHSIIFVEGLLCAIHRATCWVYSGDRHEYYLYDTLTASCRFMSLIKGTYLVVQKTKEWKMPLEFQRYTDKSKFLRVKADRTDHYQEKRIREPWDFLSGIPEDWGNCLQNSKDKCSA